MTSDERQRRVAEMTAHYEMMKEMYRVPRYIVIPVSALQSGSGYIEGDNIYIAEVDMYRKIFFINNSVSSHNLDMACNYAKGKLNKFIDHL